IPAVLDRRQLLPVDVVNPAVVVGHDEIAFIPVETDPESDAFETARVTTVALPGRRLVAELVGGHVDVRGFLVVLILVTAPGAGHQAWVIPPQPPPGDVEGVNAVVAQLPVAPVPAPVPVVMHQVVDIRPPRRRTLPQQIVQPVRNRNRFAAPDA